MIRILFGIFVMLHGLVHLLYFGQSRRIFELQTGLTWPDGAWVFSRVLGNEPTRVLASILLLFVGLGFIGGGAGIFLMRGWWRPLVVSAAALSTLTFILFWDGALQNLPEKGAVGILISAAILVVVLMLPWSTIGLALPANSR